MTSQEIGRKYHEHSVKIANIIAQLNEICNQFEYLSDQAKDNADPYLDLTSAIQKLGLALADTVTYAEEYLNAEGDPVEEIK